MPINFNIGVPSDPLYKRAITSASFSDLLSSDPEAAYYRKFGVAPTSDQLTTFKTDNGITDNGTGTGGTGTGATGGTTGGGTGNPLLTYSRYGNGPYDKAAADYYNNLNRTPVTATDEQNIRDQVRSQMAAVIDAINNQYDILQKGEITAGENRLGMGRAIAARGGLIDSPIYEAQNTNIQNLNKQQLAALEAERTQKISDVMTKVNEAADAKIKAAKDTATQNSKDYLTYLAGVQDNARNDVASLASGGVTLDQLSTDQYNKLLEATGFDKIGLLAYYNSKKPAAAQVDYKYEVQGNKLYAYGFNPVTKKLETFTQDLPADFKMPSTTEYSQSFAPDGTLILTPKTFDASKPIKDQLIIGGHYPAPKSNSSFFSPSQDEKSAALRYLNSLPGVTQADRQALETDQNFFYTVLQKAIDNNFYKPAPGY